MELCIHCDSLINTKEPVLRCFYCSRPSCCVVSDGEFICGSCETLLVGAEVERKYIGIETFSFSNDTVFLIDSDLLDDPLTNQLINDLEDQQYQVKTLSSQKIKYIFKEHHLLISPCEKIVDYAFDKGARGIIHQTYDLKSLRQKLLEVQDSLNQ